MDGTEVGRRPGGRAGGVLDAVQAFRRLMARERTYGQEDDYSVPIGSRHHSERARIWNADDAAVELTEARMRGE